MSARFSLAAYRELLAAGKESGYQFVTFDEVADGIDAERLCLLRHDVDVSVGFALDLAEIEADAGVRSTYFFMLRSPAYNLLGRFAARAVRRIIALGHRIGLHFDAAHPSALDGSVVRQIEAEAEMISKEFSVPIRAFSFHQPSAELLALQIEVEGMINTYHPRQMDGWHYASDSNRAWKHQSGRALLESAAYPRLQLLLHPMWWVGEGTSTEDVWDEAIKKNFDIMQEQFVETERAYGVPRRMQLRRPS